MDRFAELRAFTAVVEAGGFSAAGRALGQSRSSINRLVIGLEERLDAQLLSRTTRSVSPTSTGRAIYDKAKRLLEDLDEMEAAAGAVATEAAGRLRISAPQSLGALDFPAMITDFMQRHPRVEIDATFDSRLVDPVAEGFDIAVRIAAPDETTTLVDHRVLTLNYLLCAAPAYLAANGTPASASDLTAHATLFQSSGAGAREWRFATTQGEKRVRLTPVLTSNTLDMILHAAIGGRGVAQLPEYAVRSDLCDGRLVRVLRDLRPPPRMLQVIYPPARHLSARVRLFVDHIEALCSEG
ncbi:MAG: LysR family transcriptional regulator [Pseudomonadota bacterium]